MNMAKSRKISTEFFDQRWVQDWMYEGKAAFVLFYIYLFTECKNNVGVWEKNFREWNFRFQFDPVLDDNTLLQMYGDKIKPVPGHPDKIILVDFIAYQTSGWGQMQQSRVDEDLARLGLSREDIARLVRGCEQLELGITAPEKPKAVEPKDLRFVIPPPRDSVAAYFAERGSSQTSAARFCDYWDSIGWKRGARKMVDWQASARTWIANEPKFDGAPARKSSPVPQAAALKKEVRGW